MRTSNSSKRGSGRQRSSWYWLKTLWLALALSLGAFGCDDDPAEGGDDEGAGGGLGGGADAGAGAPPPGDGRGGGAGGEGREPGEGDGQRPPIPAGQLTAGEWRDLDNWDFWLSLLAQPAQSPEPSPYLRMLRGWGIVPVERVAVRVLDGESASRDVRVELLDGDSQVRWVARTDNQGRAELFPSVITDSSGPYKVRIGSGAQTQTITDVPTDGAVVEAQRAAPAPDNVLDLMFVIDTTGSMCDELRYLQAELRDVVERTAAVAGQALRLRVSVNFYRDDGDEYVVRSFPFREDIGEVVRELRAQSCGGGGDWPEAVDRALEDAIEGHAWSDSARARLLFLVLDAPPHTGQNSLRRVQVNLEAAAAAGVRVIPVASSGIDKGTEFLLRAMSIVTGGTYTFLTDHSGIGGSHVEPTIGDYEVELFNNLLVRLITAAIE